MKLTGYEKISIILALIFIAIIIIYQSVQYAPAGETVIRLESSSHAISSGTESKLKNNKSQPTESLSVKNSMAVNEKININTATKEMLTTLDGIGAVKAQSIIDDRNTNGNFKTVDDLIRVKGIGITTLEKLKPYIIAE